MSITTNRSWKKLAAAGAVATMVSLGGATSAFAAPPSDPGAVSRATGAGKNACVAAIERRLTTLDQLTVLAQQDPNTTHASAMVAELAAAQSGLQSLLGEVQATDDPPTLLERCSHVIPDYRVYALEAPTVHLTRAADAELAVATKVGAHVPTLMQLIDAAKANGADTTEAEARLADLQAKVASATAAATPIGDTVIALTPAQFNAGTALPVLQSSHAAVASARTDLQAAVADAKAIVAALRPNAH